jgi:hypothetical protein
MMENEDDYISKAKDLENQPSVRVAISAITEGLCRRNNVSLEETVATAAFLMYNLIRIQIESNDLNENIG